jgi:hypothetical protein
MSRMRVASSLRATGFWISWTSRSTLTWINTAANETIYVCRSADGLAFPIEKESVDEIAHNYRARIADRRRQSTMTKGNVDWNLEACQRFVASGGRPHSFSSR